MKKLFLITVLALMCITVKAQSPTFSVYPTVTSFLSNDSAVIFGQAFNPVPGDTLLVWAVMTGGAYTADTIMVTASGLSNVNVPVHGLVSNTTYTVHLCGMLVNTGTSGCSPTPYSTFTTWHNPTFATMSYITPAQVTTNSVKVKFHFEYGYGAVTSDRVLWSYNPSLVPGTYTPWLTNLSGIGDTAITVSGLPPNTTIYYRIESQSSFAIFNTGVGSATTLPITYCDITATAANITAVNCTSAVFGWNAILGTASTANVWGKIFYLGTLVYQFPNQFVTASGPGSFGSYLGLMPNIPVGDYTYKAYIQDIYGIDSTAVIPFGTPQIPAPSNWCDTASVDYFSAYVMFNVAPGSLYPGSTVTEVHITATSGALTLQDSLFGSWNVAHMDTFYLSGFPANGLVNYTMWFTNTAGVTSTCSGSFITDDFPPPPTLELGLPLSGTCTMTVPITKTINGPGTFIYLQRSSIGPTGPWTDSMLVCNMCSSGIEYFEDDNNLLAQTAYWYRSFGWVGVPYNRSYSNVIGPQVTQNGGDPEVQIYSVLPGSLNTELVITIGGDGNGYQSIVTANVYDGAILVASPTQSVGTCMFNIDLTAQLLDPCTTYDVEVVITSTFGTASDTRNTVHTGCVGIDQEALINLKVYPNPATSMVTISGIEQISNPTIRLIGMDGRIELFKYSGNQIMVDGLADGMYMLQVLENGQNIVFSSKLVIKH